MGEDDTSKSPLLLTKVEILMKLRGYRRVEEEQIEDGVLDITVDERRTGTQMLIRVITKSLLSSGNIGVVRVRKLVKDLEKKEIKGILVGSGKFSFSARREARRNGIELIYGQDLPTFDIFKHNLVPKHEILSQKETELLLKSYRIKAYQLPWIRVSDPAAKMIGAKTGDVLRITRNSPTAGKAIAYRYVV